MGVGESSSFPPYLDLTIQVDDGVRREQRHVPEAPAHFGLAEVWLAFLSAGAARCVVWMGCSMDENGEMRGARALPSARASPGLEASQAHNHANRAAS